MKISSSPLVGSFLLIILLSSSLAFAQQAGENYLVVTDKLKDNKSTPLNLAIISFVVGSLEEARTALQGIYDVFTATLTPDQAEKLRKLPGVIQVMKHHEVIPK